MKIFNKFTIFISVILISISVFANEKSDNILQITDAWARASLSSGGNTAIYMKIKNLTAKQVVISKADASEISDMCDIHQSFVDENGISRMSGISKLVIPANAEIELKPGGIHIMVMGLKRKLNKNDQFPIILKLTTGENINLTVKVQ